MSATTAISAAAAANAAAAAALGSTARLNAACAAQVSGYQHNTATLEEMQSYAQCINRLHPQEMADSSALAWKVIICVLIVGIVAGALITYRKDHVFNSAEALLFGAFFGLLASGGAVLLVSGLWLSIRFLVS